MKNLVESTLGRRYAARLITALVFSGIPIAASSCFLLNELATGSINRVWTAVALLGIAAGVGAFSLLKPHS